tara:strand:+ start:277 stop:540 length:264 start_codon:yes stop_codon:yes gene_type:complete
VDFRALMGGRLKNPILAVQVMIVKGRKETPRIVGLMPSVEGESTSVLENNYNTVTQNCSNSFTPKIHEATNNDLFSLKGWGDPLLNR